MKKNFFRQVGERLDFWSGSVRHTLRHLPEASQFLKNNHGKKYNLRPFALPVVLLLTFIWVAKANGANAARTFDATGPNAPIRAVEWPAYEGARTDSISITSSTSQVLRFDRNVARTAISNPDVVDITPIGNKDVLVNAKEAGIANLIVWDNSDNVASFTLRSTVDLLGLDEVLMNIDPTAQLRQVAFNETVAVYGTAETSVKLKQIEQATKAFQKNALSFVELSESKQILLEVRFAEISRKANKEFKLDVEAISRYFTVRNLTGATGSSVPDSDSSFTPDGSSLTFEQIGLPTEATANVFGAYFDETNLISGFLKWLEQKNVLKIIARPNLLAKDGEEANFVVGGEFPVPIATDDTITIDYKEFGTKLKFTPEVLDREVIRLKVKTEVSELDFSTTVNLGGIVVPSIIKREHQTVAELQDNQSFVIGGLLSQKVDRVDKKIPILGYIPFIGKWFFSSDSYERTDVELLVLVTPHIVKPLELGEDKVFYNPNTVKKGLRAFSSLYPDPQGDAIHKLITQNEELVEFHEDLDKQNRELIEQYLEDVADEHEEA